MKSSFLFALILASFVTSANAQTTKKKDKSASAPTSTPAPVVASSAEGTFDKFYERLKIGYFGAYSGSSLGHWDEKAQDEAGVRDKSYAHNFWNQISFNYNFGAKMNFVINPRFTLNTGSTSGHSKQTNGLLVLEDALIGFQGVVLSSEDKKFNLWTRPGVRLSTSRTSRENDISNQLEVLNAYTYDIDKTWQLGMYQQLRQWVYEDKYTAFRYRIYHGPYVQYAMNDTTRLQVYYENYLENRRNLKSQNGKDPNLKDYWQNVMVGVNHDVNSKFNIFPFIGYIIDARHISEKPMDPAWFGAQISYTIK